MAAEVIPPPYVITAHDKRGLIVVTGAAVLAFVWSCFLIRVWLRWQSREWRSDDGHHLTPCQPGPRSTPGRCTFIAARKTGERRFRDSDSIHRRDTRLEAIGLVPLPTVVAWRRASYCIVGDSGIVMCMGVGWPKWLAIGNLDIITEFLIFTTAIQLVYSLQMRRSAKLLVIFAFSARLPVIAIASVRLYYLRERITGSDTFVYVVATQWQMGYAIMSSTITGMGPFLKPFEKEYVASYKHYGSSHRSATQQTASSYASSAPPPRRLARNARDNMSESYLMENLSSRRGSKQSIPEHRHSSSLEPTQSGSPSSQGPISMTADEHFRPAHVYRGHEAEVWVGERSMSFTQAEGQRGRGPSGASGAKLVIGKKEEFKIEVDRASRVV
ncbi:hypothetical protein DDE82_007758 [Stemphylium lycopersici]|nr:hypothetical protein DDE82_007758 [Stemphylium lycopersici]